MVQSYTSGNIDNCLHTFKPVYYHHIEFSPIRPIMFAYSRCINANIIGLLNNIIMNTYILLPSMNLIFHFHMHLHAYSNTYVSVAICCKNVLSSMYIQVFIRDNQLHINDVNTFLFQFMNVTCIYFMIKIPTCLQQHKTNGSFILSHLYKYKSLLQPKGCAFY